MLAATAAFIAGAFALAGRARIDNSYEAFFAPDDPSYRDYLTYRDDFGSDEVSYLMYEAPDAADGVFDLEVMGQIATLTEAIEDEVPFLYEVTSLANAELVTPTPDGIAIREVWRDFPHTREAMQEARAAVPGQAAVRGRARHAPTAASARSRSTWIARAPIRPSGSGSTRTPSIPMRSTTCIRRSRARRSRRSSRAPSTRGCASTTRATSR